MADDRKVALDAALKKIEKNFGKGSIMKLGEKADQKISTIPSGSLALDVALGVGGYPRGELLKYMVLRVQVKQLFLYTQLQKCNEMVEQPLLSMLSMHWILNMRRN